MGRSTRGAPSGARHRENKQSKSAGGSDARRDRWRDARAGIDARIRLGSLPRGASRARGRHRGGGRAGLARRAESPRGDARVHRRPYYSGHPARRQKSGFPRAGERAKGSGSLARAIAGACVDARKVSRGSCACRGRRYSSARARVCAPPRDAKVDSPPVQLQREASEVKFYPASRGNVIDNRSRSFRRFNLRFQETLSTRRTAFVHQTRAPTLGLVRSR